MPLNEKILFDKLKETVKGSDTAAIKADTEALEQAFYKISEKLYQQNAGDANANPNGGAGNGEGGQNGGDGTYYNADFEDHSKQ